MKTETLALVGIAAAAAAWFVTKQANANPSPTLPVNDPRSIMYSGRTQQTQWTDAQLAQNRTDMFSALDKSDPNWWI